MNKDKSSEQIFEDPTIVAYLATKGIKVKPILRSSDNRVVFLVDSDISEIISDFYANKPVGIIDYCKNLKMIRSMLFTMKQRR